MSELGSCTALALQYKSLLQVTARALALPLDWHVKACSFFLGQFPLEMSNLATVVASGPACWPNQIRPRCALVIARDDDRFAGSSWSSAACQFILSHGSPRLAPCGKHFERLTPLDRFHTCDYGLNLMLNLRIHHLRIVLRVLFQACFRFAANGHQGSAVRTAVSTSSLPQLVRVADMSVAQASQTTTTKFQNKRVPRTHGREVDAFFLQAGEKQPRSPCESLSRFVLRFSSRKPLPWPRPFHPSRNLSSSSRKTTSSPTLQVSTLSVGAASSTNTDPANL